MDQTVDQYLQKLRLKREAPSVNYLQRLIQHHLSLVPYETFSKFHYYLQGPNYVPSLNEFVDHLINKGWGGACFTLNMNFGRLLKELGFNCSLVRVQPAHLAILIEIDGKKLYVDVGYGSPIMRPVELEAKQRHVMHGFGEEIIFTKLDDDLYEIDRRSNGKSFVKKEIIWEPLTEKDVTEDIKELHEDSDDNITMRRLTAVRFDGHQCFYLRNRTMKIMTHRNIREVQLNNPEKWADMIEQVYHIDRNTLIEPVRFLEKRGIKIFGT